MTGCANLERYLDRRLDGIETRAFEAHLEKCPYCGEQVHHWQGIIAELTDWASPRLAGGELTSNRRDRDRLAEEIAMRFEREMKKRSAISPRARIALSAAVVALALAGLFWLVEKETAQKAPQAGQPILVKAIGSAPGPDGDPPYIPLVGKTIQAPSKGRVVARLAKDQVGVGSNGRMRVVRFSDNQTRLRLESGTVACSVTPRQSHEGHFAVEVGDVTVRAIGTRFLVSQPRDAHLTVFVQKGKVEIQAPHEKTKRINAGQIYSAQDGKATQTDTATPQIARQLERLLSEREPDDEIASGPEVAQAPPVAPPDEPRKPLGEAQKGRVKTTKKEPDLERCRQWIIEGRIDEACQALEAHTTRSPGEAKAWMLLATCQRKAGRYEEAVRSYQQVAQKAADAQAKRALILAAIVLQDKLKQHRRAAVLLQQVLDQSQGYTPTRAEVMVRLATSLFEIGQTRRATRLCRTVIESHLRTPIATRARQVLEAHGISE